MKTIISGTEVKIDEEDIDLLTKHSWWIKTASNTYKYVHSFINGKYKMLHRVIMKAPDGYDVDHVNGDTLDNRKNNLRICSHQINILNQKKNKTNKSGHRGISWSKHAKAYRVTVNIGKQIHLGYYKKLNYAIIDRNIFYKKHNIPIRD